MQTHQQLLSVYKKDFLDALAALEHSWQKLKDQPLPDLQVKNLDQLESWEALTSRFARCTDIFLSKYIRLMVLQKDPGFRGEMRDYLDKAEKNHMISNADDWMLVRELRNKISHEYTKEDLIKTLKEVLRFIPFVLAELNKLK